jgi:hypothetical protein
MVTTQGLTSNQTFYAAVDISNSFNGVISDTLYFPVAGSSPATDALACGASKLSAPLPSKTTSVINEGSLIADNTWRTLNISLGQYGAESGFQARIRFCESTSNTFTGNADLLISRAEVNTSGAAGGILVGGLSYSEPMLTLNLRSSTNAPPPVTLNGTLYFSFVTLIPSYSLNGTGFVGNVVSPKVLVNSSRDLPTGIAVTVVPTALSVQTGFADLKKGLFVNNAPVEATSGNGLLYSDTLGIPPRFGNVTSALSYKVGFVGTSQGVTLQDVNGNPVEGASLNFTSEPSGTPALNATTGPAGSAKLELLPGSYQVTATYDGIQVGSVSDLLNGTNSLVMNSSVYQINVAVSDAFHHAIVGAQVGASFGTYTHDGFTNSRGIFSFQAAANQEYHLSVSVGDNQLYSGTIKSTPNNAVIQISTSYYPVYFTFVVVATIAGVIVAIVVVVYFTRWRKSGVKSGIGYNSNKLTSA